MRDCGAALVPRGVNVGLLGGKLLASAKTTGADLRDMQATAAKYLDKGYEHNQLILENAARRIDRAIRFLTVEILVLTVALVVTILY